jgi:hypothetical protein
VVRVVRCTAPIDGRQGPKAFDARLYTANALKLCASSEIPQQVRGLSQTAMRSIRNLDFIFDVTGSMIQMSS